jgi:hypothetical protein
MSAMNRIAVLTIGALAALAVGAAQLTDDHPPLLSSAWATRVEQRLDALEAPGKLADQQIPAKMVDLPSVTMACVSKQLCYDISPVITTLTGQTSVLRIATLADVEEECRKQAPRVSDQVCIDLHTWTYTQVKAAMEGRK